MTPYKDPFVITNSGTELVVDLNNVKDPTKSVHISFVVTLFMLGGNPFSVGIVGRAINHFDLSNNLQLRTSDAVSTH